MTETTCRCGKPTRDDAYVCDTCADRLSIALGEIPWLDDELETTITRQKGATYDGSPSRGAETPSPVHWGASEARGHLRAVLVSWVRFCAEEGIRNASPHQGVPDDDLPAISRWLMWRVDGLTFHDIGPEAVDEITDAVAKCHRIVDRRPDRQYLGICSAENEETGEPCTAELYARAGARVVSCPACEVEWDIDTRRKVLLDRAEDVLATAAEISRAVSWLGAAPLTSDRVRQWAARERITVRGHDRQGRPLYRVGDAIDLLSGEARRGTASA